MFTHLSNFLRHDRDGMAATEFAMIAPIMIAMFFGAIEARTAHYTGDRVHQAASIMADVTAKDAQISPGEIDDLMIGVENIIAPLKKNKLTLNLISVIPGDSGEPIVHWSQSNISENKIPYAPGDPYVGLDNDEVLLPGFSLIVAEVDYRHRSGLTGHFLKKTLRFKAQKVRLPRRSSQVAICELDDDGDHQNCV